jgi:hypothetical protein
MSIRKNYPSLPKRKVPTSKHDWLPESDSFDTSPELFHNSLNKCLMKSWSETFNETLNIIEP